MRMSIKDIQEKIKGQGSIQNLFFDGATIKRYAVRMYIPTVVVLVGMTSFSLGRLSVSEPKSDIQFLATPLASQSAVSREDTEESVVPLSPQGQASTEVIASKSGTKYYFPWCAAASRIKPENIVRFKTEAAARAAGYTPSSQCPGLTP